MSATKKFVEKAWESFRNNKGHDFNAFGHMRIVDATPGRVHARMMVERHQANRMKSLHGGLTSSLVDSMGSLALSSKGMWMTGVSTDIHVTFVRGANVGEEIDIKSEVVGQGKTLAYTRVEIESVKSGKLLAFGSHTKFIQLALKAPENVKFSEDGESTL